MKDKLCYILDPKEVHGEDFPGETFRVLKEKEVRLYGDASQSDATSRVGGVGWATGMRDEIWDKIESFFDKLEKTC